MTALPFATECTDTVVYGFKDVCMSPCVYAVMYVVPSKSLQWSPRDKACTDIATP